MTLNLRQKRFVAEYLIDGNGTRAAIVAGYSKRTAGEMAYENLSKPEIASAIARGEEKTQTRLGITAADISREAWNIATDPEMPAAARVSALALLAKRHPEFSEKLEWLHTAVREAAIEAGLDPDECVREAEDLVRRAPKR